MVTQDKKEHKVLILGILSCLFIVTWCYFGTALFFRNHFPEYSDIEYAPAIYHFAATTILFFLLPMLVHKIAFNTFMPESFTWLRWNKKTFFLFLICACIFVLLSFNASTDLSFHAVYPHSKIGLKGGWYFAGYGLAFLLFYYIPWEFFYRGFLQLMLTGSYGFLPAILLQVMASTLAHIGKPMAETYGAVFGGLFWGYWLKKEGSMIYLVLMHWILGISLDYFILFGH